jgi:hypothetical protein
MRRAQVADIRSSDVIKLCHRISLSDIPILVSHEPLPGQPLLECFSIVPEHIIAQGGEQLTGWAIWEHPGMFIEAEFHCVWKDASGALHDLTPRSIPLEHILFLPDSGREYRGRQVDNIRQPLVNDRDVIRYLHLFTRRFEITNAGDLADQHGEITLPPRALREYRKIEKEMAQLNLRLGRRYP